MLNEVKYKPLLVQQIIAGDEIDISILADKGKIVAYAIQNNLNNKYQFIRNDKLLALATLLVEASGFHGLAHFDAIEEKSTKQAFLLECNPRAWWSLFACTVTGLNFIKVSLHPEELDPAAPLCLVDKEVDDCRSVKIMVQKLLLRLMKGQGINKYDYNHLKYYLADPIGRRYSRQRGSEDYQVAALAALRAKTI